MLLGYFRQFTFMVAKRPKKDLLTVLVVKDPNAILAFYFSSFLPSCRAMQVWMVIAIFDLLAILVLFIQLVLNLVDFANLEFVGTKPLYFVGYLIATCLGVSLFVQVYTILISMEAQREIRNQTHQNQG